MNMILSDAELRKYIYGGLLHIEPFDEETVRENGLDLRLGTSVCEVDPSGGIIDVNRCSDVSRFYRCRDVGYDEPIVLEHGKTYLLSTLERVRLPNDLMAFVELRSTLARLGLVIPPTIIDAGFEGQITVEVFVAGPTIVVRPGTRFIHVVFAKTTTPVLSPYRGRYLGQRGATPPRLPI
jgi:dCTP deaminase